MSPSLSYSSRFTAMLLFPLCVLMSSLAAEEPEWVSVRPYAAGYIYGVGMSSDPQQGHEISATEATIEVVTQILQNIESMRERETEQEQTIIDGDQTTRLQQRFHSRTRREAGASALPGAEIVAQERHGGTTYTLVRLSREQFIAASLARMQSIDERLARLPEAPRPITGSYLAQLRRMVDVAQQREELYWLAVALGARDLPQSPLPMDVIEQNLGNLVRGNTLRLEGHARAPTVRDAVLDVLDILNLVEQQGAVFELRLRERARTERQGDWHRAHITGAITVVDADTHAIIGSLEHQSSDASTVNQETALSRARERFIREMGAQLEQRLLPLLAGQGER